LKKAARIDVHFHDTWRKKEKKYQQQIELLPLLIAKFHVNHKKYVILN
jgi:hypothetical protein